MTDVQTIKVWRYSTPGTQPLAQSVNRDSQPDSGRWRGETVCGSEICGSWVSDIDPRTLEICLPLPCPMCEARSGYPQLLWREIFLDCTFCGTSACCQAIDPNEEWPKEVDCPACECTITVPLVGAALIH